MSGPKRTIVFKIHSLGASGSWLTLMQSREVRINTKCCDMGLGEQQGSLFIAVAPWVALWCPPTCTLKNGLTPFCSISSMCYLLAGWGGPCSCLSNTISSVRYFFLTKGVCPAASHWGTAAFVQDSRQSLNGASGWVIHTLICTVERLHSSLPNYKWSYLTTQTCWDYCLLWKLKPLLSAVLWCGSITLKITVAIHTTRGTRIRSGLFTLTTEPKAP